MEQKQIISVAVIIPAYNEEESITNVVESINSLRTDSTYILHPIVVNDCSKDATYTIASKLNCVVLDLPVNLGIGGAMQTGFIYAYKNRFDYAIQVDGDGQHPAIEIPKLVNEIIAKQKDVVIGSRFINNKGFQSTFVRRLGILFLKFWLKEVCGATVNDSTSGFRIVNRKSMELILDYYPDEFPEPESLVMFVLNNLQIAEVPVNMLERQGGQSSIRNLKTVYYMIKVSMAIFFTYIKIKNSKHGTCSPA